MPSQQVSLPNVNRSVTFRTALLSILLLSSSTYSHYAQPAQGCDGAVKCRGNTTQPTSQGSVEQPTNSGGAGGSRSSGPSEADVYQMIQGGAEAITEIIESSERERLEKEQQLEEAIRLENERRIVQEKENALRTEREKRERADRFNKYDNALNKKSNNPWADKPASLKKAGNAPPSAAPVRNTPAPPKDPGIDYTGRSCEYFTKTSDEAHLYYHSEGALIAYGNKVYECLNARWRIRTTTDHYWAPVKDIEANRREN